LSDVNLVLLKELNRYTQDRETSLIDLDRLEKEERDAKYWRMMEWLASLRAEDDKSNMEQGIDHESFCQVRKANPGSGDWIMQNDIVTSWMDDDIPRHPVLWLHGIPGAGK
jgi:hypothetical protein